MHHPTDRITYTTAFVTPVVEHWLEREIAHEGSIWRPIAPWANALTTELHLAPRRSESWQKIFKIFEYWCELWIISNHQQNVFDITYFSFQPVLHNWCNKGRGMCYPVCRMVHIKEHLLLIDNSSLCGRSGFPFSLSEWSLTICLTPYNHR